MHTGTPLAPKPCNLWTLRRLCAFLGVVTPPSPSRCYEYTFCIRLHLPSFQPEPGNSAGAQKPNRTSRWAGTKFDFAYQIELVSFKASPNTEGKQSKQKNIQEESKNKNKNRKNKKSKTHKRNESNNKNNIKERR